MAGSVNSNVLTCSCGQKMKLPADMRGKTYKCVKCGEPLVVGGNANGSANTRTERVAEALSDTVVARRIGKILLDEDLITKDHLKEALEIQKDTGGRTFEILVRLGYLDKDALHSCLSKQQGIASIDVKNYHIPRNLLSLIPADFARKHVLLPIDKLGRLLTIGMACPLDANSIQQVERITGLTVKPMLCKLDDIKAALGRYFPVEEPDESAESDEADADGLAASTLQRVGRLEVLSGRSATVQQVLGIIEGEDSAICGAAELIGTDPCLTARVLSVANAPAYGLSGRVTNVYLAITLVGLDGAIKSVLATSKGDMPTVPIDYEPLWTRSLFAATAARGLAKRMDGTVAATAYTAALLHELGRFALAQTSGELYAPLCSIHDSVALLEAERQAFGVTHAEVGEALGVAWGLPADLVSAIRYHHEPEQGDGSPLISIVALAAQMAEVHLSGDSQPEAIRPSAKVLKLLDLDRKEVANLFNATASEVG